jgi:hypothetical protein
MKGLNQVNPVGRLDVLAFRLLERVAQSQAPQEWPLIQPLVEQQCREWLGPKGRLWR